MKIYTKTGDKGQTSLFGGKRVNKSDIRVEAYGTIDEFNSFVGMLIDSVEYEEVTSLLSKSQHILFNIGSHLATEDPKMASKLPSVDIESVEALEKAIDTLEAELEPMTNFILPSGHKTVSLCHVCRTVCRRAERRASELQLNNVNDETLNISLMFLNRMSDYLFVLARYLTKKLNATEVTWNKEIKL